MATSPMADNRMTRICRPSPVKVVGFPMLLLGVLAEVVGVLDTLSIYILVDSENREWPFVALGGFTENRV